MAISILPITSTRVKDRTGLRYGRLVVLGYAGNHPITHQALWACRCDCGVEKVVRDFRKTQGCGCYGRDVTSKRQFRHGMTDTPMHQRWSSIIDRCENPNCPGYPNYGGRGIRLCERWHTFENFLKDILSEIGDRPSPRHSIDRKDNDGHYSCGTCDECRRNGWPMNCRWATMLVQSNNRRSSHLAVFRGKLLSVTQHAREQGFQPWVVLTRLRKGWGLEQALTTPLIPRNLRRWGPVRQASQ